MTTISFAQRRREERAREIAIEIDPKAGDFFRRCLIEAAIRGMAWQEAQYIGAQNVKEPSQS